MLNKNTLFWSYSWEEFGQIVTELSEQVNSSTMPTDFVSLGDKNVDVLTTALRAKQRAFGEYGSPLTVALDNSSGLPDVVVTKFIHSEEQFQFHEPKFYFDTYTVDVENRFPKIVYPWQ